MTKLENLKKKFDVIELENRLEMVQLAAVEAETAGNSVCCCSSVPAAEEMA